jgi:hypothetical protein
MFETDHTGHYPVLNILISFLELCHWVENGKENLLQELLYQLNPIRPGFYLFIYFCIR